jgi:hypothetical protein
MRKKCRKCKNGFTHFLEQKSYQTVRKRAKDKTHSHYGIAYYRYGICEKHHYNKLNKVKVIWDPCLRCKIGGVTKYKRPFEPEDDNTSMISNATEIVSVRMEVEELRAEMARMKAEMDLLRQGSDDSEVVYGPEPEQTTEQNMRDIINDVVEQVVNQNAL